MGTMHRANEQGPKYQLRDPGVSRLPTTRSRMGVVSKTPRAGPLCLEPITASSLPKPSSRISVTLQGTKNTIARPQTRQTKPNCFGFPTPTTRAISAFDSIGLEDADGKVTSRDQSRIPATSLDDLNQPQVTPSVTQSPRALDPNAILENPFTVRPEPSSSAFSPNHSRQSSLASHASTYSSASSMARHRAERQLRQILEYPVISHNKQGVVSAAPSDHTASSESSLDTVTEVCAPYLVPPSGPPVSLEWVPDPEAGGVDEAEEVWKRIETKMGRRLRGTSLKDRGRWVVKLHTDLQGSVRKGKMERRPSDFSVSAYFDFGNDGQQDGTAIFDMAAPLVTSVSSSAATPWNTPCLRRDTLQRADRVVRKRSVDEETASTVASPSTDPTSAFASHTIAFTSDLLQETRIPVLSSPSKMTLPEDRLATSIVPVTSHSSMCRLDSHVVSALEALRADFDTPELDAALTTNFSVHTSPELETGLGVGLQMRMDSVYGLSNLSPRPRRICQPRSPLLDDDDAVSLDDGETKNLDPDVVRVTDLDTGRVRDVQMGLLDEVDLGLSELSLSA